jgi:four helix bundle protein
MSESKFEDLEIYQLAEKLSDLIWNIVLKWNSFERNTIGVQFVNASDSVGANISEGYGRGSFADRS